ncbi:MAG: low molecular weight phosphotyrosine protein phosphatase [Clostridia bacterium]|nr:low molecular weight phosphotyrosine protein phosphatase [Clostridia bacterium]
MIKILFVCHGNICRSPMAEFVFLKMVKDARLESRISVDSCATSTEEIGNGVYPPAKAELFRRSIPMHPHRARQITKKDYEESDYVVCMDNWNLRNLNRMTGGDPDKKVHRLLDFTGNPGEVADPWYSDRFDVAFDDIFRGCEALLKKLQKEV